jgi:Phage integrase family
VHTLRHFAAVAWLEAGVHVKAIADLLGHSSISITGDIYGHSSDEATRAAIDGPVGNAWTMMFAGLTQTVTQTSVVFVGSRSDSLRPYLVVRQGITGLNECPRRCQNRGQVVAGSACQSPRRPSLSVADPMLLQC